MKCIPIALIGWVIASSSFSQEPSPQTNISAEKVWTKDAVNDVLERAKVDPDVLWELENAPLDLIQKELWWLWGKGKQSIEGRELARKRGREAEWVELEKKVTRDPDYDARVFPIAREVLLTNPQLESYMAQRMEHSKEVLLLAFPDNAPRYWAKDYADVMTDYKVDLGFAENLPGDIAFRLIGPFLFSPYFPDVDHGDVIESSPAIWALGSLARVGKKRPGEEIPKDIEHARQWWRTNEHRFAVKAAAPESPAATPLPRPAPTPAPSLNPLKETTASTGTRDILSRRWLSFAVGIFVLLALFLLKKRPRH